jgi:nitroimidazol reductase NimA-like FMN-containing flavoprotein (pyridoxamine 5'-phosphate oxidase superfamily)
MRRAEREIKDRELIEAILRRATVCRIATCSGGLPYIVPMSFGYESGCLYLHSAPEGKKIDILRRNPRVCFEVDVDQELVKSGLPCQWGFKYRSVIGFGRAVFLEEPEEKERALNLIVKRYSGGPARYAEDALAKVTIIKVEIESMTGKQCGY